MKNRIIKLFFIVCIVVAKIVISTEIEEERQLILYPGQEFANKIFERAVTKDYLGLTEFALQLGADPDLTMEGSTPLNNAIGKKNLPLVTLLVKYGANLSFESKDDCSLSTLLGKYTYCECFQFCNYGSVNEEDRKAVKEIIHIALKKGNCRMLKNRRILSLARFIVTNHLVDLVSSFVEANFNFAKEKPKNILFSCAVRWYSSKVVKFILDLKIISYDEIIKKIQENEKKLSVVDENCEEIKPIRVAIGTFLKKAQKEILWKKFEEGFSKEQRAILGKAIGPIIVDYWADVDVVKEDD